MHSSLDEGPTCQPLHQMRGRFGAYMGSADQGGRPTAHGPHRLSASTWHLLIGLVCRFYEVEAVAPSYKYKGRGEN